MLEAIARDALGGEAGADRALEHALDQAEPDGVLLPFLLHPVPDLLERQARHRTELYVSQHTVKTHIRHLYAKLGPHRRAEAIAQARVLGLLAPSPPKAHAKLDRRRRHRSLQAGPSDPGRMTR